MGGLVDGRAQENGQVVVLVGGQVCRRVGRCGRGLVSEWVVMMVIDIVGLVSGQVEW